MWSPNEDLRLIYPLRPRRPQSEKPWYNFVLWIVPFLGTLSQNKIISYLYTHNSLIIKQLGWYQKKKGDISPETIFVLRFCALCLPLAIIGIMTSPIYTPIICYVTFPRTAALAVVQVHSCWSGTLPSSSSSKHWACSTPTPSHRHPFPSAYMLSGSDGNEESKNVSLIPDNTSNNSSYCAFV